MISSAELALLISGAISEAVDGVLRASGRQLTREEAAAIAQVVSAAMRFVAERSAQAARPAPPPPPQPTERQRRHARFFDPYRTAEFRAISPEEQAAASRGTNPTLDLKMPKGTK